MLLAAAQIVDEHLFDRFVVTLEDVADSVATDKMTDLFGKILGVITGAFEGLRHKDDLQTGLPGNVFRILDVAKKDKVAEPIDFGIGAENIDRLGNVASREALHPHR